ncbi:flagellar hook capping FlgD N-terminal domain-containing protein [Dorea sp. D27]|uniref:flagellar hook capping FlgD N-terminal domain-containing protein n=1 Tax=Dorea sp. D27 TaxID=658665 RepID=UPI000673AC96|nr:flagellar hook capping FlgD N-terminal domain-containing protein [Dorea sp. D27]KMZ54309.1 flagellar hook capping protein [Dorea sp. D27]
MNTLGSILSNYGNAASARTNSADNSTGASSGGTSGLSINDFYKLLSAQLRYQDADNPMDTSEMMAQMVQTQMIQAITDMSAINLEMYAINTISYASSMVGKTVTMAEVDKDGRFTGEKTTGVVTGVLMGNNPSLFIDGKEYTLSQVMTVGEVPDSATDSPEDEGGKDGST